MCAGKKEKREEEKKKGRKEGKSIKIFDF